jgi:disulfide bond formation protein DsbB
MASGITYDQIRGPIERVLYIGFGFLAGKQLISSAEVANYVTLAAAIIAAFLGWYQNRPVAVMEKAAALDPQNTKIVTTPSMAAATPSSPNIVSSSDNKVVARL